MASRLLVVLACALCALRGAAAMEGSAADPPPQEEPAGAEQPEDPRCKKITCDADERDFWVFLTSFAGTGFYEESDIVVEEGMFNGFFIPADDLSNELTVNFTMDYKSGDTYTTVACVFDTLQGLLEKVPNVVMCVNCFLNPKMELPLTKPQNGLELNNCQLYPRLFPPGFPLGKYFVFINQTCDGLDSKFCGSVRVDFELKAKAE